MNLNDHVTDSVSGFHGKVTAICTYLDASTRLQVTATVNDKGDVPVEWFDEARLQTS